MVAIPRRRASAWTVLGLLFLVTGCTIATHGHYDPEFSGADAIDVGEASGPVGEVGLRISDDGTFTATKWPAGLYCDDRRPQPGGALNELWNRSVDFAGEWEAGLPGSEHVVQFISNDPACPSNWSAVAWTVAGGPTRLRVDLSPLTSADEVPDSRFLFFSRR